MYRDARSTKHKKPTNFVSFFFLNLFFKVVLIC